jgi:hypothetical protein
MKAIATPMKKRKAPEHPLARRKNVLSLRRKSPFNTPITPKITRAKIITKDQRKVCSGVVE